MSTIDSLFVPELAPAVKHPTVFKKFDALNAGEGFLLINDHDPIPLFYELKAERGDSFEWKKIEDGPEWWKVEIFKKEKEASCAVPPPATETKAEERGFVLNVTLIEPKQKHPTIFRHFDALQAGEAFRILNDHDPKPLYYQMIAERGNVFSWKYLQKGPQWWEVEIKKNEIGQTVGELAAKDIRKAEVFKKFGIDFCCGGKKSLAQACEEAQIDINEVEAALEAVNSNVPGADTNDYLKWEADFLADYIYNQHHRYYYEQDPVIHSLLTKVAGRHGQHHPELFEIKALYANLQDDLRTHFMKEEKVLFPFIKALANAKRTGDTSLLENYPSVKEPVQMMEADHEMAGEILLAIRKLANDFTPPQDGCNSYQLLYKMLADLEADLHKHVHLENNILFPKALALEKELRN